LKFLKPLILSCSFLSILAPKVATAEGISTENTPTAKALISTTSSPTSTNESLARTPDQTSWWSPKGMKHSIGVELSDANYGALGTTAIAYGYWREKFGLDVYFGYSKDQDTAASTITTTANDAQSPKTSTIVKEYTGRKNPKKNTFGIQPKLVFVYDRWFRASLGFLIARSSSSSVSYSTGSISTTFADSTNLKNYSVTESDYGTITTSSTAKLLYGPRVNAEFVLKWFPHIALGFGTGVILSSGADTTAKTLTKNRSYTVTDGTAATPTTDETSSIEQRQPSGGTATTLALGGSTFSLLGSFSVRYIW
jgi:hypothetical protein